MKTILSICFLVTFVGLMLIGCSDKSISPVETAGVNDNPVVLQKDTGPGAWIFKYEGNLAFWIPDEETGLVITFGIINDPWTFCSDFIGETFSFKDIFLPNADPELRRIIEKIKGNNLTAKIWKVDPWPISYNSFCNFFGPITPFEPFAVGTANFSISDNDVLAGAQDNKNSNVYAGKANGTLFGSDGKKYQLNYVYRLIWDGDDFTRWNEVIKIQLTPAGK